MISISKQDAANIVQSVLAGMSKQLSPAGLKEFSESLSLSHDGGPIYVTEYAGNYVANLDGSQVTIRDFLSEKAGEWPVYFQDATAKPQDRAAGSKPTEPDNNPWLTATRNLTKQALITRRDPALAARLKAEAAQADGIENPWHRNGWNVTAQMKIAKADPAQAKRFMQEANFKGIR